MPTYPHIDQYREELQRLLDFGGSDNESSIRRAFAVCLDSYCREHRERLALVDELAYKGGVYPDGTVKDSLRMARGYWEAKDTHDDLDAEIQNKFNKGYPRDNIIFEDSQEAVLIQDGDVAMRVDMRREGELNRLIRLFLDYELPEIEDFRRAQAQFKDDLPTVLASLRETIEDAERDNAEYQDAAAVFLELCHQSIGSDVSSEDVREMLMQHILTKDIFLRVFGEDQFHRENNIAAQLDKLERTFFTGDTRRQAIDRLRTYYGVIGRAADEIADYAEKQSFLKAIYEDFYKAYNPDAADRLGVVYTPNEVVDFIIRGTDYLLQKHFQRGLADENVQILDPATGTGTFITNLIEYLPADKLEHKYRHEMHANEVAILPYYIANLNIEYTYREKTGQYVEFPNLVFVDTLDNMDWKGATGGAVQRQGAFELGRLSSENRDRMQAQNEKEISVILGNPPYNANQANFNDFNPNRKYPAIDRRIKETYVAESTAQKTKQYDMYKRFLRWASDRLDNEGIIAFVTNRAYLDSRQDDGFRKVVLDEFSDVYIVDLGGNYQSEGNVGNVFGITIGVAIGFLVRRTSGHGKGRLYYYATEDEQPAGEKLNELVNLNLDTIAFEDITPDSRNNWLNQSESDFGHFLPLVNRQSIRIDNAGGESSIFNLCSIGVSTNRDYWVYDFDSRNLRNKVRFFTDSYNELLDKNDHSYPRLIKWSDTLRSRFQRGERIVYSDETFIKSMHRAFAVKNYFAGGAMNDRLTRNHYEMFGSDLKQPNRVICPNGPGSNYFSVLATDKIIEKKCIGTNNSVTFCLPLYRYTGDGERVSNVTDWGLRRINAHYRKEFGERFEEVVGGASITAEDVFAYTYAVLHDPVYRHDYAVDLLREFPRLPLYHDWDAWVKMGRELLELHIGFEDVEPYPLERVDKSRSGDGAVAPRVMLRANAGDKERGEIHIDSETVLRGVPEFAWEYKLGNRTAIEWVLNQYKKKPRDPTIPEQFSTYRFADYKEDVIGLLRRVCTVSVQTMEVVDGMAIRRDGALTQMEESVGRIG